MPDTPRSLPKYFNGMELDSGDFAAEQAYFDAARARYNRNLHTWGIASGLDVAVGDSEGINVTVAPGLAIDPNGREIVLAKPQAASAQSLGALGCRYANLFIRSDAVPTALSQEAGTLGYKRIERRPAVFFRAASAGVEPDAVFLARAELDADGRILRIEQEARRYCGFNLASLQLIDPKTAAPGATLAALPNGGVGIEADGISFAGSVAVLGDLTIGRQPPRALLDLAGNESVLLLIRNQDDRPLLTVRQTGEAGIRTDAGSARLTVSGDVELDGGRAIHFDGSGAVGAGPDCCIRFDAAGPNGKPLALRATKDITLLPGEPEQTALTVLPSVAAGHGRAVPDVWIGGKPVRLEPPVGDAGPVLLTVLGPVQSLSGGFAFGSEAVQQTAALSRATIAVGTVVDWWPGPPGKGLTLPEEFAYCEGQEIVDAESPYNNQHVPDLVDHYVRGATDHDRIGLGGGAKEHTHTFTPSVHVHSLAHGHAASPVKETGPDAGPGQTSDPGGPGDDAGSAIGHSHTIDLTLAECTGDTGQNAQGGNPSVTGPADNTPRSARLVKIIRIK